MNGGDIRNTIAKEFHRTVRKNISRRVVEMTGFTWPVSRGFCENDTARKAEKGVQIYDVITNAFRKYAYAIP